MSTAQRILQAARAALVFGAIALTTVVAVAIEVKGSAHFPFIEKRDEFSRLLVERVLAHRR